MAIRNIKEIIDTKGYVINSNDRKIFEDGDLQSFFGLSANDAIEFIIYDINNNQLPQMDGQLVRYIPLSSSNISNYFLIADGTEFQKYKLPTEYFIDVEKLLKEAGYRNGIFKTQITLINKRLGSDKLFDKLWIQQISPSRTEIRLQPLKDGIKLNSELKERYHAFVNGNDFFEDLNINIKEFTEKILPNEVLSFVKTTYTNEWFAKLVDEFKIQDFQKFITNVHSTFTQSVLYQFDNKISSINDVNYGKPKPTKRPLSISKKTLLEICERIFTETVNYYLPAQNIINNSIKVSDFLRSEDEVTNILQRRDSDVVYQGRSVETEVRALVYPNISERQIVLEQMIKKETSTEKEVVVIADVQQMPYTPPPPPADVEIVPIERIAVTPIIREPIIESPLVSQPIQSTIPREFIPVFEPIRSITSPINEPVIVLQPIQTPPPPAVIPIQPTPEVGTPVTRVSAHRVIDADLIFADDDTEPRFISVGDNLFPRLL